MPYDPRLYGQPPPGAPFVNPKKSKKGLIIGLSVLGVLIIGAVVAVGVLIAVMKDRTIATDMKLGDCIAEIPTDSRVMALPTVDCAAPHGGEVFAVIDMPDGDYPGQSRIDQYQNKCPQALSRFAPDALTDDSVGIYVLYPTPDTWKRGDRAVTCIATLDPKRTGSLKG
jgi:Septum formation